MEQSSKTKGMELKVENTDPLAPFVVSSVEGEGWVLGLTNKVLHSYISCDVTECDLSSK
jgi:hypothetical protein